MADFTIRDHTDFAIEQLRQAKKNCLEYMLGDGLTLGKEHTDLHVDITWAINKAIESIEQSGLRIATKQFKQGRKTK